MRMVPRRKRKMRRRRRRNWRTRRRKHRMSRMIRRRMVMTMTMILRSMRKMQMRRMTRRRRRTMMGRMKRITRRTMRRRREEYDDAEDADEDEDEEGGVDSGSDDGAVTSLWPGTTGTLRVVGTRAGPPSNPTSPGTTTGIMLHVGTPSTALDMSPLVDAAEVLTCPLASLQVLLAER